MTNRNLDPPSAEYLTLITKAQRSLYAFIVSMLRRTAEAEDVLQETNLVLWQKAHEFAPGTDFMAWALRIAQLQTLAHLKKVRRSRLAFDDGLVEQLAEEAIARRDMVEERRTALARCLEKLPPPQREVVAARYQPGGSVQAMAAARQTTPKALSELLRRVRKSLLECIERSLAREAHS